METPPIPLVQSWARAYDAGRGGGGLLDLSQAVPGYPTADQLVGALREAVNDRSLDGYGDIEGEGELRAAFAAQQRDVLGASVASENILITSGCNQAFVVAALTLVGAGGRVMLTNPMFFNNASALDMLGIATCSVGCGEETAFMPEPERVEQALGEHRPAALALVSPNNPTGATYDADRFTAIQHICAAHGTWLIVDETYAEFISEAPGLPRHRLLQAEGWEASTVLLTSFSKAYCAPGLRVGAMTAGAAVVNEAVKVVDNLQICAPRAAQRALARSIAPLESWRAQNRSEITRRVAAFRDGFAAADGWEIVASGAYFAYVRHPFTDRDARDVCEALARDVGVVALPGSFFGQGQGQYMRMAVANVDATAAGTVGARLAAFTL